MRSAKGISNSEEEVGYLSFSQRLIFYAGSNIIVYSSHRRTFELVSNCKKLLCLRGLSLSTQEKEYIMWSESRTRNSSNGPQETTIICLYDMTRKEKVVDEKYLSAPEIESENI